MVPVHVVPLFSTLH